MEKRGEIVVYQSDGVTQLEVRLEDETVWLNRQQISSLFDRDIKTIGKHINNALREELLGLSTVANFATVQLEGGRSVSRMIEYYNLDVIISVGYRVKSKEGTQFRIWANRVLKEYLMRGYAVNRRIDLLEKRVDEHDERFEILVKGSLPPSHGVFYDGQIFDAYLFVADIIKSAKVSLILIDNYIDESVLHLLSKRGDGVSATIYTASISPLLSLDIQKHNSQYPPIKVNIFSRSHDRFLIVDEMTVYHIGASLKDLGQRWFAFSKIELDVEEMLSKLIS